MADLLQDYRNAAKAISVSQQLLQISGRNIMKAGDEHYAKQSATVTSEGTTNTPQGQFHSGIMLTNTIHARNDILDRTITKERMRISSLAEQFDQGRDFESIFKADISNFADQSKGRVTGGFTKAINDFFNNFHTLSQNPGENYAKTLTVEGANNLVRQFNLMAEKMTDISSNVDEITANEVEKVNTLIDTIGTLNSQIYDYELLDSTRRALDDRDLRQKALEELADIINFRQDYTTDSKGQKVLSLVMKDDSNVDVTLLSHATPVTPLDYNGTNVVTVEGTPRNVALTGGKTHGLLEFKNNLLGNTHTSLDSLAQQFVTSFNAAYNPSANPGGNFFDSAGTTAATIALDANLTAVSLTATATANPGANELTLALAELKDSNFSTGSGDSINGTFLGDYINTITQVGQSIKSTEFNLESENLAFEANREKRMSESGVSLDEEVAEIMKQTKLIQAQARYLNVVGKTLDELFAAVG